MSGAPAARRRVVVTGVGMVTPIGVGKDAFWSALVAGTSAVDRITHFDPAAFPTQIAAEVRDFDPLQFMMRKRAKHMDRTAVFGVASARMAVDDAALDVGAVDMDRIGVIVGTSRGQYDYDYVMSQHAGDDSDRWSKITPEASLRAFPEACASQISIEFGIAGPSLTLTTTGSSALDSIGHAMRAVRYGELDVVLTGGAQSPIHESMLSAFGMTGIMSRRNDDPAHAMRPFDRDRDGFVLGEGGGILVVEELEHARRRGAHIYGELTGYASTCDPLYFEEKRIGGRNAARCIQLALLDAGVMSHEIDAVNATGLSMAKHDAMEARVLHDTLGARATQVPVSAVKSMIGHLVGAAGSVEMIAALLGLEHQIATPTINYATPDPDCALDVVPNVARPAAQTTVLKTSIGFGGINAAMVARRLTD